jgi:hypothetical protein
VVAGAVVELRVREEGLSTVLSPAEGLAVSDTVPVNPFIPVTVTPPPSHHQAWGYTA